MKVLNLGLAVAAVLFSVSSVGFAQITSTTTNDVRLGIELNALPGQGERSGENGGNDPLLIGRNDSNVEIVGLVGFEFPAIGIGEVATGGTLEIDGGNDSRQAGSPLDRFVVRELFDNNRGWVEGNGLLNFRQNSIAGAASFDERAIGQLPWLDDSGAPVDNLFGAFDGTTQLNTNTVNGIDGDNTARFSLTFDFTAADSQRWAEQGFVDLILQAEDNDGDSRSRFFLLQENARLTIFTESAAVPEPSSFAVLGLAIGGLAIRRKRC